MTDVFDPERLRQVGSVLERYAKHIAPGHIIRLGMEGDPASTFRSTEDAPSGRVLDVTHHEGGEISFRASLQGDQEKIVTLNNRDIDPARIWEIHPDHLSSFREDIFRGEEMDGVAEAMTSAGEDEAQEQEQEEARRAQEAEDERRREQQKYRSSVDEHLQRLEARLEEQAEKSHHFRAAMAEAVRGLSDDILRAQRGEAVQFADDYASSFDRHVRDDRSEERRSRGSRDERRGQRSEEEKEEEKEAAPRFPEDFSDAEEDNAPTTSRFAGVEEEEDGEGREGREVKRISSSREEGAKDFDRSSKLTDEDA